MTMVQTSGHPNLPSELYYPICKYIAAPRDLRTFAASARALQRPAEAALHHTVILPSRRAGVAFCAALKSCPRFALLVRELTFEWPTPGDEDTSSDGTGMEYWRVVRAALEMTCALHTLVLDDGRDLCLSWVLDSLRPAQLRVLRCAFVLDAGLLGVLHAQSSLEELAWTGALIALPETVAGDKDLHSSTGAEDESGDEEADLESELESGFEDPDAPLLAALARSLPRSTLSRLRILHAESLALARALVPGRPVTHLWVPGASFGAAYASDYLYRHISALSLPISSSQGSGSSSSSTSPLTSHESPTPRLLIRPAGPAPDLSPQAHATHLRCALRAFARGTRGVCSLRIALDLPPPELRAVLACMANALPHLRALAYLPAAALEPSPVSEKTGFLASNQDQNLDQYQEASIFPPFSHLHTLSVWSTPSRGTLRRLGLERAHALPALRTLACLHFSPAFEWMCLPVGDEDNGDDDHECGNREPEGGRKEEEETATGGIRWQRVGAGLRAQRRPTALHDPENLLWRDV
ncbi:hypothetical protein M0805_002881 [Coniferiporia weirii]|nr:hypothetical protein M0805_002881 [Coniferiporia weirii]